MCFLVDNLYDNLYKSSSVSSENHWHYFLVWKDDRTDVIENPLTWLFYEKKNTLLDHHTYLLYILFNLAMFVFVFTVFFFFCT